MARIRNKWQTVPVKTQGMNTDYENSAVGLIGFVSLLLWWDPPVKKPPAEKSRTNSKEKTRLYSE